MLKFLGGIIIFIAVLLFSFVLIGLSVIAKSFGGFRNFFRMRRAAKQQFKQQANYEPRREARASSVAAEDKIGKSYADKILDRNESEYVDFEDIPNKE